MMKHPILMHIVDMRDQKKVCLNSEKLKYNKKIELLFQDYFIRITIYQIIDLAIIVTYFSDSLYWRCTIYSYLGKRK